MRRSQVLVALLMLADLGAQRPAPERQPCTGRVVDENGGSVAQAEITFVFTPGRISPGTRDVVTVTTDERGRFLAQLCVGNLYTGWAMGPLHDDGSREVSAPRDLLGAGRTVELALIQRARLRRIRFSGLDTWKDVNIAHVVLHPDARHDYGIDLGPLVDSAIELPPTPIADACLFLADDHGRHVDLIGLDESLQNEASFRVRPPRAFDGLVVDRHGSPIAGAVAEMLVRTAGLSGDDPFGSVAGACGFLTWKVIGTSDADGRIVARLPKLPGAHLVAAQGQPLPVTPLRVSGSGFAPHYIESPETGLRVDDVETDDGHQTKNAHEEERQLERVELLVLRDRPLAVTGRDRPQGAGIGGWIVFPGKPSDLADPTVPVILSEPHGSGWRVRLGPTGRFQPWFSMSAIGSAPLRSELPEITIEDGSTAIPIGLGTLKRWQIEIVDSNGAPAAAAVAVAYENSNHWIRFSIRAATDAAGRVDLWLPDEPRTIYATTGSMDAMCYLDDTEPGGPLRLALEPIPRMRVHVVDQQHHALAGARVLPAVGGGSHQRSPDPASEAEWLLSEQMWIGYTRGVRGAPDGLLEIPVFAHGLGSRKVIIKAGDRRSLAIPLEAGERPEVVLR